MALAGDFFGDPDNPISDGATDQECKTRFINAFNSLYNASYNDIVSIIVIINQQAAEVQMVVDEIKVRFGDDAYSYAYSYVNRDNKYDKLYNKATGGSGESGFWLTDKGRYLKLAATNWDHFGKNALKCYQIGHQCALDLTVISSATETPSAQLNRFKKACMMEAFAQHYLTDLFSSGHLRVPRKCVSKDNSISLYKDPSTQVMHDEDSYNGLWVSNLNGDKWICYGDKRYNDPPNVQNVTITKLAVEASISDINNSMAALQYESKAGNFIPNLDSVLDASDRSNWAPLFVYTSATVQRRTNLTDLLCYEWSSSFAYGYTYRNATGGIHSRFGAPPDISGTYLPFSLVNLGAIPLKSAAGLIPVNAALSAAIIIDPQAPTVGEDATPLRLHIVYRDGSLLKHVSTSMGNAPYFLNPVDLLSTPGLSPACANGDPAILACEVGFLLVYPDAQGILWQTVYDARTTNPYWTKSTKVFISDSHKIRINGQPKLCIAGNYVYLAFADNTPSYSQVYISQGRFSTDAPFFTFSDPIKPNLGVTGITNDSLVYADPTIVEYDGCLMLGGLLNIGGSCYVATNRLIETGLSDKWSIYTKFNSNMSQIHLLATSGIWGQIGIDLGQPDGTIALTYCPDFWQYFNSPHVVDNGPNAAWKYRSLAQKTYYAVSAQFYKNVPFIIFSDRANKNSLSIITKADHPATNIALKKTSFASSYQTANPASHGNDGNNSTRWCAHDSSLNCQWTVDLNGTSVIVRTEVLWEQSNAYQYKIETSLDNSQWFIAVDNTSNVIKAQHCVDPFSAFARYVRITITGGLGSGTWASFYEMSVYGYPARSN